MNTIDGVGVFRTQEVQPIAALVPLAMRVKEMQAHSAGNNDGMAARTTTGRDGQQVSLPEPIEEFVPLPEPVEEFFPLPIALEDGVRKWAKQSFMELMFYGEEEENGIPSLYVDI